MTTTTIAARLPNSTATALLNLSVRLNRTVDDLVTEAVDLMLDENGALPPPVWKAPARDGGLAGVAAVLER